MSPMVDFTKRASLFSVFAPRIDNLLVRVTLANTTHVPSSIQHTLLHAGKNSLVGGRSFKRDVEREIYRVQSTRWILRKALLRWLFKRLHICTTTDIVTLEPIQRPISIVDWTSRHIYSFEATTLHRHTTCSLLHRSGLFPYPLRPTNPLTNLPLSLGQLISVWNSLAHSPLPLSSVVSQYRSVGFHHRRFREEYATPLSLSSMKRCILDPLDRDGGETLFEFIEHAYDFNQLILTAYSRNKLRSSILAHSNGERLRMFRLKCIEYNSILITKKQDNVIDILEQLYEVYRSCMPLCRSSVHAN